MNWAHLKAFVWLRWRLMANRSKRAGRAATITSAVFGVMMVAWGVIGLIVGFLVGLSMPGSDSESAPLLVWGGAAVAFAFFWLMGLFVELQASELLALDRFFHLPVSPGGAFLINYFGSSVSLSLVIFLPAMVGMSLGLVWSGGPALLLTLPLVAAFFLMVTAVTYQFRGWLAGMMSNPRRRRTVVAVVSMMFVLVFQIPNYLTNLSPAARERRAARTEARRVIEDLDGELAAGGITREEYDRRRPSVPGRSASPEGIVAAETVRQISMVVPLGWLPYGAEAAGRGRIWTALACIFGMALIGTVSLSRAYRTTIRLYTGDFTRERQKRPEILPAASATPKIIGSAAFLERRLPWVSERASAVAVATFRSLARAPEVKMIMLSPVLLIVVFGGMFASSGGETPELIRPLMVSAGSASLLVIGLVRFVGNQFGYDRNGFRALVLSSADRRDVLMGKNLALLPFAFVLMGVVVTLYQWFTPMRIDHLVGVFVQWIPMYLVFCLAGNLLSIFAPIALKVGSGMPAGQQGLKMLCHLGFMILIPVPLGLTFLPLGVEALLSITGLSWFPAFLVLGIVQAVIAVWLYSRALGWEGGILQGREQRILEIVGSKAE